MSSSNTRHRIKVYGLWFIIILACAAALYFILRQYAPDGWVGSHGLRILIIVAASAAASFALRWSIPHFLHVTIRKGQRGKKAKEELDERVTTLSRVFAFTGMVVIILIAAFMILAELNINIAPLLAGFGIMGVAIGFGAQYLIRDLIGGLFVIMEDQYNIGDVVKISGIAGIVEDINLRRTVIRDLDGIVHFVPNGESGIASNYTREWSRANLDIEVSYGTDLDHAISVINHVCAEMADEPYWKDAWIKTPEVLRVNKLGSSGIEIKILGDTKPIRQWETMGEIRKRVKKAFDEEGIEIPWPHTKVYFGEEQPEEGRKRARRPSVPPQEARREALPPDDQFQG
jgi:small-conductance mechanosensitive channel